ncbi:MAG: molybdate ABC transporter permease subunit [Armatimonadetes bacterium]|nr:molybdate ABC transporter permease subunit [Armatimonadota bacterium]
MVSRQPASALVPLIASSSLFVAIVMLPLIALFFRLPFKELIPYLQKPMVYKALFISFESTLLTTVISVIIGTPVAYLMAYYQFRGKEMLDSVIDMPVVLPPAVAGIALALVFNRSGLVGSLLTEQGIILSNTFAAVVIAQIFVSSPYFIKAARSGFESINPNLEKASLTLGASRLRTFFQITVPLSTRSLIVGVVITWARALGEFGATLMFAGNTEGKTQTMPLAIYSSFMGTLEPAIVLSCILIITSFIVLISTKFLLKRSAG